MVQPERARSRSAWLASAKSIVWPSPRGSRCDGRVGREEATPDCRLRAAVAFRGGWSLTCRWRGDSSGGEPAAGLIGLVERQVLRGEPAARGRSGDPDQMRARAAEGSEGGRRNVAGGVGSAVRTGRRGQPVRTGQRRGSGRCRSVPPPRSSRQRALWYRMWCSRGRPWTSPDARS